MFVVCVWDNLKYLVRNPDLINMPQATLSMGICEKPPKRLVSRKRNYADVVNSKLMRVSPNYRIKDREAQVIQHLRVRMKLSVNHIASVLGRSTSTIHTFTSWYNQTLSPIDNRKNKPRTRSLGVMAFKSKLLELRLKVGLYLRGFVQTLEEAIHLKPGTVNIFFEGPEETENTSAENEEDPA